MESLENIFKIAVVFFIVTNPIGNSPMILALVKDFDFERQKKILLRETFFALILVLFFQYCGEAFLSLLHIQDYALTISGGLLLFLVALSMIFVDRSSTDASSLKQEPFIVPIATPLLSGPGLLSIVMLKSKLEDNDFIITSAILIAWIGVVAVMAAAPYLQKLLGKRGLAALEQLMGLILAMISMGMIVTGGDLFVAKLTGKH